MRWMAHPTRLSYLDDWRLSPVMVRIQGRESMNHKEMMSPESGYIPRLACMVRFDATL